VLSQTQGEGTEHQRAFGGSAERADSGADETRRIRSKHRQNDDETKQPQSPSTHDIGEEKKKVSTEDQ
jgi:hypothetical protein